MSHFNKRKMDGMRSQVWGNIDIYVYRTQQSHVQTTQYYYNCHLLTRDASVFIFLDDEEAGAINYNASDPDEHTVNVHYCVHP